MNFTKMEMTFDRIVNTAPLLIQDKLKELKDLRERPDYHPEPNTFEHIRIVTERLMQTGDIDLIVAGVMHDICKKDCVQINPKTGYPTSPGHDKAAAKLVGNPLVMGWIISLGANPQMVSDLCEQHMRFHQFGNMKESKQRAFREMPCWDKLVFLGAADNMLEEFDVNDVSKSWKWNK